MNTFTNPSSPLKFFGAVLALALIATAAALSTGLIQAQDTDDTSTPVQNTYADPQPCGEGASKANLPEPHEITSGHFALFDSYWQATFRATVDDDADTPDAGVLHTNLCPPLVTQTTKTQGRETITVTTRSAREEGMDIDEAIMHVLDKHKADVVATSTEVNGSQLSLEEYPGVRNALGVAKGDAVPEDTQVWWLRLDDPDTTDADETSDLSLGFSTLLLSHDDWHRTVGDNTLKPLRYKFLVERYPGDNPADGRHFLAYEAPKTGGAEATLVWDSTMPAVEQTDVLMNPGEFRALQWVFTKPGTYLISVQLQGFVRKAKPDGAGDDWRPVSGNETETSEVKQYTIQVGSDLSEMEPPLFGVNLSVSENSPGGVKVGDPIPVYESEADALTYSLDGDGHANFKVVGVTDPRGSAPHAVQIVVADGAILDFETKTSYNLTLSVTDGVDHENNEDDRVDDTLAVRIDLEDQPPGLELYPDPNTEFVAVGETVTLFALYEPTPAQRDEAFIYQWAELIGVDGELKWRAISVDEAPSAPTLSVSKSTPTSRTYKVDVVFSMSDVIPPPRVPSNHAQVRWFSE